MLDFDEPDTSGRKFRHDNYKVQAYIGRTRNSQRPMLSKVDTECGLNLISKNSIQHKWRNLIVPHTDMRLCAANGTQMDFRGVIKLNITLGDLQRQVLLGLIRHLPVNIIIGTRHADRFIRSIEHINYRPVPILKNEGEPSLMLPLVPPQTAIQFKKNAEEDPFD